MSPSETSLEKRVADLEKRIPGGANLERLIKGWTLLGAVLAFGWGLYQYIDTTRSEFRKAFWEKRYALYSKACTAAAKIAVASDLTTVQKERDEFWNLYWGELSIVESKSVHDAMVAFGNGLGVLERQPESANGLKRLSYFLARACRESLKDTWEPVPLDDIPIKPDGEP
jgi:hypothetical protein